jgi:hypothetical protein
LRLAETGPPHKRKQLLLGTANPRKADRTKWGLSRNVGHVVVPQRAYDWPFLLNSNNLTEPAALPACPRRLGRVEIIFMISGTSSRNMTIETGFIVFSRGTMMVSWMAIAASRHGETDFEASQGQAAKLQMRDRPFDLAILLAALPPDELFPLRIHHPLCFPRVQLN